MNYKLQQYFYFVKKENSVLHLNDNDNTILDMGANAFKRRELRLQSTKIHIAIYPQSQNTI